MARRDKGTNRRAQRAPLSHNQSASDESQGGNQLIAVKQQFQGPLPPPGLLQEYERIHPGTAERILQQFERETQHRHLLEQKIVEAQIEAQGAEIPALRLGQIFAFVIAVVGLLCAAYCVVHAKTSGGAWAGASIGGVSLATLVGIFIYGRKSRATVQDAEDQAHSEK